MRDPQEHPVDQPIVQIDVDLIEGREYTYRVGNAGVTRIEACTKSGVHANIPYVRVWSDDICRAEFCQHNIAGIYFGDPT